MSVPFQIKVNTDRIIRGDFYPTQGKAKANIIVCHGFKGFKDWAFFPYVAQTLAEDYHVITFNFSHNGVGEDLHNFTELDKFAKNTYTKELEDVHTVVEHILQESLPFTKTGEAEIKDTEQAKRQPDSQLPLFLLGHSRGGGVSLLYAFDHPQQIAGVISWNGITNVDLFSAEQKAEMKSKGRSHLFNARTQQQMPLDKEILKDMEANRNRFDIIGRAANQQVPIILVQGTEDHPHLVQGSERLTERNPSIEWVKINTGNHTFNAVHPFQGPTQPLTEAIKETKQFITRHL